MCSKLPNAACFALRRAQRDASHELADKPETMPELIAKVPRSGHKSAHRNSQKGTGRICAGSDLPEMARVLLPAFSATRVVISAGVNLNPQVRCAVF